VFLADWARLARWPEWAVSKLPFSGAAALLLVSPSWVRLLAILATVALGAAFGYGVNEVADRRTDRDAGKPNRAAGIARVSWTTFLLVTAAGALGLSLTWAADAAAPALVLLSLALALAYSVPPVRLKARGLLGIAGAAVAQWALPVLAVSAAQARCWTQPAAWSMALLGLALGVRWMAIHQRGDAVADRRSGVSTLAAFAAEPVLLLATLIVGWPRSIPAAAALLLWLLVELTQLRVRLGPLHERVRGFRRAPLAGYYFVALPLALAVGRRPSWPDYPVVVALFFTLASPYAYRTVQGWSGRSPALQQPDQARGSRSARGR